MKLLPLLLLDPAYVASSREDAWIETGARRFKQYTQQVASSREDAWIETGKRLAPDFIDKSRPPARTRGLKHNMLRQCGDQGRSRPPARTRGLKHRKSRKIIEIMSRPPARTRGLKRLYYSDRR